MVMINKNTMFSLYQISIRLNILGLYPHYIEEILIDIDVLIVTVNVGTILPEFNQPVVHTLNLVRMHRSAKSWNDVVARALNPKKNRWCVVFQFLSSLSFITDLVFNHLSKL